MRYRSYLLLWACLFCLISPSPGWAGSLGSDSHFGFMGSEGNQEHYRGAFTDLGLTWMRPHPGPFSWDVVEPSQGEGYDFSRTDAMVISMQELGAPMVVTIWPYATWDQQYWMEQPDWQPSQGFSEELPLSRYKPHDMAAYRAFVQALVERYDGDGIDDMPGLTMPIKYWEALNEPETSDWALLNFFKGDAADYLEVLQATRQAVEAADPQAVVLQAGCTGQTPFTFWEELLGMGGADYFQVGNLHSITPSLDTEDLNTGIWAELMQQYGIDSFWLTEVQVASGTVNGQTLSEEEQARFIFKGYVRAFANGAQKIFYTVYQVGVDAEERAQGAALITAEGRKKPAWYALHTLVQKLDGFTAVETLAEGQYKFTVDQKAVYVLWGSGDIPEEISGLVKVTTYTGDTYSTPARDLVLGEDPLVVEES